MVCVCMCTCLKKKKKNKKDAWYGREKKAGKEAKTYDKIVLEMVVFRDHEGKKTRQKYTQLPSHTGCDFSNYL